MKKNVRTGYFMRFFHYVGRRQKSPEMRARLLMLQNNLNEFDELSL